MKHIIACFALAVTAVASAAAPQFDVLIRHGRIMDGTGSPWYTADVGIRKGRIAAIGRHLQAAAQTTIDAQGLLVTPGFIDMLGQSELTLLVEPHVPSKIFQGITTEVTGEGNSVAPIDDRMIAADSTRYEHLHIRPNWRTLREYFARLQHQGLGINLATYVGATSVRRMVLGDDDRAPSPEELGRMQALVADAMRDGAFGLSSALQYAPAPYASTQELIALAAEAGRFGGIYATHMRSEQEGVMAALDESIRIGREAHVPVEIWHLKAAGRANWGKMPAIVAKIDSARASGVDITADTYAYTAWFNDFSAFVPPWAHDGGDARLIERMKDPATRARIRHDMTSKSSGWDNEWLAIPGPQAVLICVVQNPALRSLQGKTLAEAAAERHQDPIDALLDILIEDKAYTAVAVFGMAQPDVTLALEQPWVSIDNDSEGTAPTGLLGQEHPHPRAYGTFPRILRKYVREEHRLGLADAIRKFTALPAQRMGLSDRGVLKQGMWADIAIFDPQRIHDTATFANPNQLAVGMQYVLVNGVPVIAAGKPTQALPGQVLHGPGYQAANGAAPPGSASSPVSTSSSVSAASPAGAAPPRSSTP
ncbi:MAG TPA: D-aminoacylase [Steroidobacteraceae bacterium]